MRDHLVRRNRAFVALGTAVALLAVSLTNWGGLPWGALLGLRLPDMLLAKTAPQALASGGAMLLCARAYGGRGASARARVVGNALGSAVVIAMALALALRPVAEQLPGGAGAAATTLPFLALGAACGAIFWLWGNALLEAGRDQADVTRLVVGALAAYSVLYAVSYALAPIGRIAFLALCVAASGCLYAFVARDASAVGAGDPVQADDAGGAAGCPRVAPGEALSKLSAELICVMASVFAFSFVRTTALASIRDVDFINRLGAVLSLVFSLAALVWWLAVRGRGVGGRPDAIGMYRVAFPVIATVAAALPLVSASLIAIAAAVLHAAFFVILATLVVLSASCSEAHGVRRGVALGILGAGTFLSASLSTLIAYLIYRGSAVTQANVLVCALAIVYVLAMAYVAAQHRMRATRAGHAGVRHDGGVRATGAELLEDLYATSCATAVERFSLTDREADVLRLLVRGYTQHGIADGLCVTENTVRTHLRNLYRKLGVHSRQEVLELLGRL
jgi:DNA-binding CsgD family transcriptional regulator